MKYRKLTKDELIALFQKYGAVNFPTQQQLSLAAVDGMPKELCITGEQLDGLDREAKQLGGQNFQNAVTMAFNGGVSVGGFYMASLNWDQIYNAYLRWCFPDAPKATDVNMENVRKMAFVQRGNLIAFTILEGPSVNANLNKDERLYLKSLLGAKIYEKIENVYVVPNAGIQAKKLIAAGFQEGHQFSQGLIDWCLHR